MKRFLAGIITGFVASLLTSPAPGKANRAWLKADAQKRGNELKTEWQRITSDVKRLIDAAKKGSGLLRG